MLNNVADLIVHYIVSNCHWEPFQVILNVSDNLYINIILTGKSFNAAYIIIGFNCMYCAQVIKVPNNYQMHFLNHNF